MQIIKSLACTVRKQARFPISKRRRILAKWAKRDENCRQVPGPHVYVISDNTMIGHPQTLKKITDYIGEELSAYVDRKRTELSACMAKQIFDDDIRSTILSAAKRMAAKAWEEPIK